MIESCFGFSLQAVKLQHFRQSTKCTEIEREPGRKKKGEEGRRRRRGGDFDAYSLSRSSAATLSLEDFDASSPYILVTLFGSSRSKLIGKIWRQIQWLSPTKGMTVDDFSMESGRSASAKHAVFRECLDDEVSVAGCRR